MELLIKHDLLKYLIDNDILTPEQFGFCPNRSVSDQLLTCLNDWTKSYDKGIATDCVYLDMSKAFDTVDHVLLLKKLYNMGIKGDLLSWIQSYLSNRRQRVFVNNSYSSWSPVTSGVPQGSVLGPVLFLAFVNDIPSVIKNCTIKLYADDIKLYLNITCDDDVLKLQQDLNAVSIWCDKNRLKLNVKKCVVLRIGNDKTSGTYFLTSLKLETVSEFNDLGVIIDKNLTFSSHCARASSKAMRIVGMLRRCFITRDKNVLLRAYNCYVRPILEYCSSVIAPFWKKDVKLLEKPLRKVTKIIVGVKSNMSYEDRLQHLRIPSVVTRRLIADLSLVHKIVHKQSFLKFSNFFEKPDCDLTRKNNDYKLKVNKRKTSRRENSFALRVVNEWNKLDNVIVKSNLFVFKATLIKNYIIPQAGRKIGESPLPPFPLL